MTDYRKPKGLRHKLACCLTIIALATVAGCKGPHAMAQFAQGLNHAQRRRLRCRPRRGRPREYDMPRERTIRRLLKRVDPQELKTVLVRWMQQEDPTPPKILHADGKVVKNADPAPARATTEAPLAELAEPCEIPPELQKPKADKALTLVNFQTTDQRLGDQIAVPQDTNKEAALAAQLPKMDLAGLCLTTDAAHLTKANCRQLTQNNGADFFMFSKPTSPQPWPKPNNWCRVTFPPQASTLDKGHGRIELRELWCAPTDPATLGLAGVAQVLRIHRHVQHVRQAKVIKQTDETAFAVTTIWAQEAGPQPLLQMARDHWSIENGQHHRRDRTQDEDHCTVRHTHAARNLSLFRSLAIFLFEQQAKRKGAKKSLPDFESRNHSHPWALIRRLTDQQQE